MKLGIDIGGTFTDFVFLDSTSGLSHYAKTLTTYPDPTLGIFQGIDQLKKEAHMELSSIETLVHGTTLVTNAVIERKGVRTGLITTKGFEDVIEIGREMRYDIYDLFLTMPKPLVARDMRVGITERMNKSGQVVQELDIAEMEAAVDQLVQNGAESIAVVLLHAYANPVHEQLVAQYIRTSHPGISYSISSEVMPEIREYERCSATVMNAYVQPITDSYLLSFRDQLKGQGFQGKLLIMDSAGRLTTLEHAAQFPILLLESGPAGGTMAGVHFSHEVKEKNILAFDMGGTTAKASLIRNHQPEITNQFEAAREKRFKKGSGLPVRIPVIDMIEIGAGGGSIAQIDGLGLIQVGPESASSTPGPAAYNRGGQLPTVTDADLVLGYLNPEYFLGGNMTLDVEKARYAIEQQIAEPLGLSVEEAAWGIHHLVNENMANAARVHIIEKGFDPTHFPVMAFGGAGPVHAYAVARLLHAKRLIVPGGAGVLSALGFLVSPIAHQVIASHVQLLQDTDWIKLNDLLHSLHQKALQFLQSAGCNPNGLKKEILADMRYKGQGHEITVSIPEGKLSSSHLPELQERFNAEYRLRYGRCIEGMPIESVTWRVTLTEGVQSQTAGNSSDTPKEQDALKGTRKVYWNKGYIDSPVYNRYLLPIGQSFKGPAIIEETESTTVVGPNSQFQIDSYHNIIIDLM